MVVTSGKSMTSRTDPKIVDMSRFRPRMDSSRVRFSLMMNSSWVRFSLRMDSSRVRFSLRMDSSRVRFSPASGPGWTALG